MLAESVALHDVKDVEKFVQATINASRRFYRPDERDELVAEGFRIMVELSNTFDPHRAGYEEAGRFSGFAAKYLRLKLEDAYHRLHPEHILRTQPNGSRAYVYGDRAASLDAMTAEDPDRHDLLIAQSDELDVRGRLRHALDERWERRRDMILDVGDVLSTGGTGADAQAMLGLTSEMVHEAVQEIMLVADRLRSGGE